MKKIYLLFITILYNFCITAQSYNSTTLVSGLQYPVAFDVAPDGRFFITEKGDGSNTVSQKSRIRVYSNTGSLIGVFYDLSDSTNSDFERGVLGISLDPDFTTNHYVYVYYNHLYNGDERIRIVRFTEASNIGTNPVLIFDLDVANNIAGNHVGGNLHFRPSQPNHIYFTIGDLAYQQSNPTLNYANKLTNPYGKILRINKNGTVPTDNPYYDNGDPLTTNCDWIWSYGHRNAFDFCFSPVSDSMYCSENGLNKWDEANLITKGSFYGWASCEGNYVNNSTTVLCSTPGAVAPITTWGVPLPSVTGILYYSGTTWNALNNHLLVAENNNGILYDCTLGNAPAYNTVTGMVQIGDLTASGGLTTLKQSADGCIFAMKGGYTTNGLIYKVCPLSIGVHELISPSIEMIVFPNPAKNYITVEMTISEEREIELQLTDIYGRSIRSELVNIKTGKNTHTIELDQQNMAKGIYVMQLKDISSKQLLSSKKIVIE
ncbi:MAG: PQQ-dependent sugar dehydrogenase [Bacteroidota bacterium]